MTLAPSVTPRRKRINGNAPALPRRVNFHTNGTDFMCAMLFNIGMESEAIANLTGLTKSQVEYRVRKVEWELRLKAKQKRQPFMTARKMYRKGMSPVSKIIIKQITGQHSRVKQFVTHVLDQRGLYAPKAKGVLKDSEGK